MRQTHFTLSSVGRIAALALFLSACGGQPTPTNTPEPTAAATADALSAFTPRSRFGAIATTAAENSIVLEAPVPGELVTVVADAGSPRAPAPFDFNLITYQRYGGPDNVNIIVRLRPDGSLDRNGVVTRISQDEVSRVRGIFNRANFFQLNGVFSSAEVNSNTMYYNIGVDGPPGVISIPAQDGLIPPELMILYDTMETLGMDEATPEVTR